MADNVKRIGKVQTTQRVGAPPEPPKSADARREAIERRYGKQGK